ncbi:MAG: HDOD domain-containing protein, partial [Myxococcales bacterium]|nr:HDOD domain-containing protein [Myxococcales bacterium]
KKIGAPEVRSWSALTASAVALDASAPRTGERVASAPRSGARVVKDTEVTLARRVRRDPDVEEIRPVAVELLAGVRSGRVELPRVDPRLARFPDCVTASGGDAGALADVVIRDRKFAKAVVRIAQGAAFIRGVHVEDVRSACEYLGAKALVAIYLEQVVRRQFAPVREPHRSAVEALWRKAIVTSRVAPLIGAMLDAPWRDQVRCVALFHNAGGVMALSLLSAAEAPGELVEIEQLERDELFLAGPFGELLAERWGVPSVLTRAADALAPDGSVEHAVLAARAIAIQAGHLCFPGHLFADPVPHLEALGLGRHHLAELRAAAENAAG